MKKVEIMGQEYLVILTGYHELNLDGDSLHGLIDYDSKRIYIDNLAIDEEKALLHEVIHGILFESGMCNLLEGAMEEALAHSLENGLWNLGYRRCECQRRLE